MRATLVLAAALLAVPTLAHAQEKLLLTTVAVSPTQAEFVAITNPGTTTVDLTHYYLADFDGYYNVVLSTPPANNADFVVQFPAGATIAPGETQTVSIAGAECFNSACGSVGMFVGYGSYPTYEVTPTMAAFSSASVPDMITPFTGAVGSNRGLTNGGEPVILFYWDSAGPSPLVTDVDYVYYGVASGGNPAVNKTGVSVMGSTYLADTADSATLHAPLPTPPVIVSATCRSDMAETGMTTTGGNGVGGSDETSEPCSVTWVACADPMITPPADAGVDLGADAGPPTDLGVDLGGPDSGPTDGGPTDLGVDLGGPDSGPTDGGASDMAVGDAGHDAGALPDGGARDGGSTDATIGRDLGTSTGRHSGGCCSAAGTSSSSGLAVLAVLALVALARTRRRRS